MNDEREAFEARATFLRALELRENPVEGAFDATHLREINRRIFQDLPGGLVTQVPEGAEVVYIGTVRYQRDDFLAITAVEVRDDMQTALPAIRARFPQARIEKALLIRP